MTEQAEEPGGSSPEMATPEDVAKAVDVLTDLDLGRLHRAAAMCLGGTPYASPNELVNDAISQTYVSAGDGPGRRWPRKVPFMAFLMSTIQGLASDLRKSAARRRTDLAEDLVSEGSGGDPFGRLGHTTSSPEDELMADEEQTQEAALAQQLVVKMQDFFSDDAEVQAVIEGILNDTSPAEVQQRSGMTDVQYASARRRWRRGLAKILPKTRHS